MVRKMSDFGVNDYVTTYKKDYPKRQITRVKKCEFQSHYKDIISGPYTYYILPSFKITGDQGHHEDPKKCFHRLRETYPVVENRLDKEVDEDKISSEYENEGRTLYQVDFCKLKDGFVSKKTLARERVTLPADWKDSPQTTQRNSYRDFRTIFDWKVIPKPVKPPPVSLKPNHKEREILKVKTGDSEYNGKIGKVGTEIIRDCLHGVIEEPDFCESWKVIELNRAGLPYKVRPPYPVLTL